MSRSILIYGHSGAGKTTSCRNLDPKTTFIIDCDGKGLSWQGWRKDFNGANKNYCRSDYLDIGLKQSVGNILKNVAATPPFLHIKTIIIDGLTTLMTIEAARRRMEKGYDKWSDLAYSVIDIIRDANHYRDDLTIVFIGHVDTDDDADNPIAHVKTSGRKLSQIVVESFFTTVLYAKTDGENYWFETAPNRSTAKSPMGALPAVIDNDIAAVIEALNEFEEGKDEETA